MNYEDLTEDEQAWVRADEAIWQQAHALVARHPRLDVSGVYHTLIHLRRSPDERLARSLAIGRAFAKAQR